MAKLALRLALVIASLALIALAVTRLVDIPHGDAAHGEILYEGASSPYLACIECHEYPDIAPAIRGLPERVRAERLAATANADQTVEEYLAVSILDPDRYVVPNYRAGVMPPDYARRMTAQDLQDLVAYLMTL